MTESKLKHYKIAHGLVRDGHTVRDATRMVGISTNTYYRHEHKKNGIMIKLRKMIKGGG